MHFPIIKIEPIDLAREAWDFDLDYGDECLNEHTDYYGEIYNDEDRRDVITSDWLRELLDGIATIDTEKETITFLDKQTILNTLNDYYLEQAKTLFEKAAQQRISRDDFRKAGERFRDFNTLFVEDYGKTSLDFVGDAEYNAGETVQIGNIFDAHF
mgnify:CR=1 FL=1